jgi:hypothetical protein
VLKLLMKGAYHEDSIILWFGFSGGWALCSSHLVVFKEG